VCNETKIVSPETWPYRNQGKGKPYKAHGQICTPCDAARKKKYRQRADELAADAAGVPDVPIRQGDKNEPGKDAQREAIQQSRLDVAKALKIGSKVLNEQAPNVLAKVLEMFEDDAHPQHTWAVQFLAERILPRKLYEELGNQAAGVGLADKRPQYFIQVVAAQPDQPQARPPRVIDAETVTVIPAEPTTKQ
jgi:hypothetical protein